MRRLTRGRALFALAAAVGLSIAGAGPAFAAPGGGSNALTCSGGEIGSGTYSNVTVTGACSVASGAVVSVTGNVSVRAGAAFDAQRSPSTITVGGNVTAAAGSTLGLGCQPPALVGNSAHACVDAEGNPIEDPSVHSDITVNGNVTATGAAVVLVNGIHVGGNLTVTGGGSPDIPWSIKNNSIQGNVSVSGVTTNWFGLLFNTVGSNVSLTGIKLTEDHPGAERLVYVGHNTIARNLSCTGLSGVSGGFPPGSVNTVGGKATGQCAGLAG